MALSLSVEGGENRSPIHAHPVFDGRVFAFFLLLLLNLAREEGG